MPKPAAAAATTTQRQSGERHHHHHHHHHHRRREDTARRQQEDPQREEQQDREAAEESARQGPISMTDFEKRCETIKLGANEALLWMSDYRKLDPRRKKRRMGGLLTELQEKKGELTDQYMALADLDVDTSAFDSDRKRKALLSNAFSKLTAVQRAVGELTQERDSLGEGKGSPEAKRRYFQEKLKSQYAYKPVEGDATIRCEVGGDPLEVTIQFLDHGKPYNPLAKEDPDVTLSAEERGIGGLGIFMVKKSMDSLDYEYHDGKNILTIKKSL